MFIVTEGRENVEMGLVEVKAIEADSVDRYLQRRYKQSRQRVKSKASEMEVLLDSLAAVSEKLYSNRLTGSLQSYTLDAAGRASTGEKVIAIPDEDGIVLQNTAKGDVRLTEPTTGTVLGRRGEEYVFYRVDFGSFSGQVSNSKLVKLEDVRRIEKVARVEKRIKRKQDTLKNLVSQEYYFSEMPSAHSSDETGSDGNYKLTVESGIPHYLVARASRSVGDEEEEYYWMVKTAVEGGETKEVNLSNNNLGGVADKKYALDEPTLSTVEGIWQSAISLAKEGEEMDWEKLIYQTAFPEDSTDVPIPDDLHVPEEKLLSDR